MEPDRLKPVLLKSVILKACSAFLNAPRLPAYVFIFRTIAHVARRRKLRRKISKAAAPDSAGRRHDARARSRVGELRATTKDSSPAPTEGAIRSRVTLVQVPCTVAAPDGTQVRGLNQNDFHLFEDGAAQEIASFDASATPASVALVIDASPSIFHELGGNARRGRASLAENLSPADEIAVVSFSSAAHLLLPFSKNRALLERAIESQVSRAGWRIPPSRRFTNPFFSRRANCFRGARGGKRSSCSRMGRTAAWASPGTRAARCRHRGRSVAPRV